MRIARRTPPCRPEQREAPVVLRSPRRRTWGGVGLDHAKRRRHLHPLMRPSQGYGDSGESMSRAPTREPAQYSTRGRNPDPPEHGSTFAGTGSSLSPNPLPQERWAYARVTLAALAIAVSLAAAACSSGHDGANPDPRDAGGLDDEFTFRRFAMVAAYADNDDITDSRVLKAMSTVPREEFVLPRDRERGVPGEGAGHQRRPDHLAAADRRPHDRPAGPGAGRPRAGGRHWVRATRVPS